MGKGGQLPPLEIQGGQTAPPWKSTGGARKNRAQMLTTFFFAQQLFSEGKFFLRSKKFFVTNPDFARFCPPPGKNPADAHVHPPPKDNEAGHFPPKKIRCTHCTLMLRAPCIPPLFYMKGTFFHFPPCFFYDASCVMVNMVWTPLTIANNNTITINTIITIMTSWLSYKLTTLLICR